MKLLHRLLATAGLAALLGPHAPGEAAAAAAAAARDGPDRAPAATRAAAARGGELDPKALDRIVGKAFAGGAADPGRLAAMLPDIVARAIGVAPPGTPPELVATQVAGAVAGALARAGVALDAGARANLAGEVVANVEAQYAALGVEVDRVAVASAALGGVAAAGGGGAAAGYTAATAASPAASEARDVDGPRDGGDSAY